MGRAPLASLVCAAELAGLMVDYPGGACAVPRVPLSPRNSPPKIEKRTARAYEKQNQKITRRRTYKRTRPVRHLQHDRHVQDRRTHTHSRIFSGGASLHISFGYPSPTGPRRTQLPGFGGRCRSSVSALCGAVVVFVVVVVVVVGCRPSTQNSIHKQTSITTTTTTEPCMHGCTAHMHTHTQPIVSPSTRVWQWQQRGPRFVQRRNGHIRMRSRVYVRSGVRIKNQSHTTHGPVRKKLTIFYI